MKSQVKDGKYMSSVKVGPKGQIVIPKEVRDLFQIEPGDTLMLLADAEKGIAIERYDGFEKIADAIFRERLRNFIRICRRKIQRLLPNPFVRPENKDAYP